MFPDHGDSDGDDVDDEDLKFLNNDVEIVAGEEDLNFFIITDDAGFVAETDDIKDPEDDLLLASCLTTRGIKKTKDNIRWTSDVSPNGFPEPDVHTQWRK